MKYLMFVCADPATQLDEREIAEVRSDAQAWVEEMDGRGVRLQGNQLAPVSDATTVRVREGEILIADGPFAETKEQIGGYYMVDCKDLDEAIEIAAKIPAARLGSIEVRPIWEM